MIIGRTIRGGMVGLLLALSLAACSTTPPTGTPEPEGTRAADGRQWALDFAACMREHGIDMEDPDPNGGSVAQRPADETPERQEATAACLEKLGPSPVRDGGGSKGAGGPSAEEMHEQLLAMAKCLRDLGYDVKDPAKGSGLGIPEGITEEDLEKCAAFAPPAVPAQ